MKKVIAIALAAVLLLCLAACTSSVGNYKTINSQESSGDGYWTMRYEKFDGSYQRSFTLSGEGEHTFSVDIVSDSGALGLTITDGEGTSLYRGSDIPTSSFDVVASGKGKYTIAFEADEHSGSFSVEWA